jgi:hypothetical protein
MNEVYIQVGDDESTRRQWPTLVPDYLQLNHLVRRLGLQRDDVLSATLTLDETGGRWLVKVRK